MTASKVITLYRNFAVLVKPDRKAFLTDIRAKSAFGQIGRTPPYGPPLTHNFNSLTELFTQTCRKITHILRRYIIKGHTYTEISHSKPSEALF